MVDDYTPPNREAVTLSPDAKARITPEMIMALQGGKSDRPTNAPGRRGRPPGSKNRPKVDDTGQVSYIGPPSGSKPSSANVAEAIEKKVRAKQLLAKKRAAQVQTELNEGILMLLVSAGVPPELLYKVPPETIEDTSNYQPLAKRIVFSKVEANILGRAASEIESSQWGAGISSKLVGDSPLPMIISSVLGVAVLVNHVKNVLQLRDELAPFLEAYKESKKQAKKQAKNNVATEEEGTDNG
jgi:hypothetical protein